MIRFVKIMHFFFFLCCSWHGVRNAFNQPSMDLCSTVTLRHFNPLTRPSTQFETYHNSAWSTITCHRHLMSWKRDLWNKNKISRFKLGCHGPSCPCKSTSAVFAASFSNRWSKVIHSTSQKASIRRMSCRLCCQPVETSQSMSRKHTLVQQRGLLCWSWSTPIIDPHHFYGW